MHRDSKKIKVRVVHSTDLIKPVIECRRPDAQAKLAKLLSSGYTLFDMSSASGGFATLGALAAGKYVVVWKGAAAASYNVALANITNHTDIVVLLVEVNSANQIVGFVSPSLTLASGDYAWKLTIFGGTLQTPAISTPINFSVERLHWIVNGAAVVGNVKKTKVRMTLNAAYTETLTALTVSTTVHITGTYNYTINVSYSTTDIWMSGVVFEKLSRLTILGQTTTRVFNFSMVKLVGFSDIRMALVSTTTESTFYYDTDALDVSLASSDVYWNQVGTVGQSDGTVNGCVSAFDQNGILYVAYIDGAHSSKLTVKKFQSGSWSVVGSTGVSPGTVSKLSMVFDTSNNLYVSYIDGANSSKLGIMKWNGSAWSQFVTAGSTVALGGCSMVFYGTIFWVFYYSTSNLLYRAQISLAGAVTTVAYGVEAGWNIYAIAPAYCITSVGGYATLYFAESTATANGLGVSMTDFYAVSEGYIPNLSYGCYFVPRVSGALYRWSYLNIPGGGSRVSLIVSSVGSDIDSNKLFSLYANMFTSYVWVAYKNTTGNATVKKYGTALETVGSASFAAGAVSALSLTVRNDTPYLAYSDGANSSKLSCMKYDDPAALVGISHMFTPYTGNVYSDRLALNTELIDVNEAITVGCKLTPQNTFEDGELAPTMRNGYRITFPERRLVKDVIKNTGAEDIMIRFYEYDSWIELTGKSIKNLKLYSDDLSTYSFNNNDNVLVRAEDVDGNEAYFVYYNKKWYRTYYSDTMPNKSYRINCVFQLWKITDNSDFINDFSTIENSPLESGTITVNNRDNEVITA